jgi:hypothetical protein
MVNSTIDLYIFILIMDFVFVFENFFCLGLRSNEIGTDCDLVLTDLTRRSNLLVSEKAGRPGPLDRHLAAQCCHATTSLITRNVLRLCTPSPIPRVPHREPPSRQQAIRRRRKQRQFLYFLASFPLGGIFRIIIQRSVAASWWRRAVTDAVAVQRRDVAGRRLQQRAGRHEQNSGRGLAACLMLPATRWGAQRRGDTRWRPPEHQVQKHHRVPFFKYITSTIFTRFERNCRIDEARNCFNLTRMSWKTLVKLYPLITYYWTDCYKLASFFFRILYTSRSRIIGQCP